MGRYLPIFGRERKFRCTFFRAEAHQWATAHQVVYLLGGKRPNILLEKSDSAATHFAVVVTENLNAKDLVQTMGHSWNPSPRNN